MGDFHNELTVAERSRSHCSSLFVLQTSLVRPVFESITVVTGRQLQVTVLAFSCLTTTQCSMSSAAGGGSWLRMGGGVAATCFFAAQPVRSRQNTSQAFLMHRFRLSGPLVDYFNEAAFGSCAFCRGFVLFAAAAFLVGGLLTLLVRCSCFWSFLPAACLADTGFTCAVLG